MDLMESENFRKIRAQVRNRFQILYDALDATYKYQDERQTVHSRILYFEVEILLTDYITGRTR